jgi:hypothetical protein
MASDGASSLLINWGSRAVGVIAVPISIYFFSHWNDTLQKHGEVLSSIQTSIDDLKNGEDRLEKGQDSLKQSFDTQVGQIINTQQQVQSEVAALEQANRDREGAHAIEASPRWTPPPPQNIPAAIGAAISHLTGIRARGRVSNRGPR